MDIVWEVLRDPSKATARDLELAQAEYTSRHLTPEEYATSLARAIWEKHFKETAPDWKPLPDLIGVLTQIDNMTAGMVRAENMK